MFGVNSGSVHMGLLVGKVTLRQVYLPVLFCLLQHAYLSINAPRSFTHSSIPVRAKVVEMWLHLFFTLTFGFR